MDGEDERWGKREEGGGGYNGRGRGIASYLRILMWFKGYECDKGALRVRQKSVTVVPGVKLEYIFRMLPNSAPTFTHTHTDIHKHMNIHTHTYMG
jgi:hypothetical protein